MTTPFGARLRAAMDAYGPFCAGLDPHRGLVEQWGLEYSLAGLERFAMTCVEAYAGTVAVVKPQSAFFEVFGSGGIRVLERVLGDLRDAGTLTLLDVKRGDIGSTMQAYAEAYLGKDSDLRADAVTVSPFLGYGSLRPTLDLAEETGRGVFVLALTSNPEGFEVQHAVREDRSVAASVVGGRRGGQRGCGGPGRARQCRAGHRRHRRRRGPRPGDRPGGGRHADPGAGVRRAGWDGRGAPAHLRRRAAAGAGQLQP